MEETRNAFLNFFALCFGKYAKCTRCFDLETARKWINDGHSITVSLYDIQNHELLKSVLVREIDIEKSILVLPNCNYRITGRYPYSLSLRKYELRGFKMGDVEFPVKEHKAVVTLVSNNYSVSAILKVDDCSTMFAEIKSFDFDTQTLTTTDGQTINFNLDNSFIVTDPCSGYKL